MRELFFCSYLVIASNFLFFCVSVCYKYTEKNIEYIHTSMCTKKKIKCVRRGVCWRKIFRHFFLADIKNCKVKKSVRCFFFPLRCARFLANDLFNVIPLRTWLLVFTRFFFIAIYVKLIFVWAMDETEAVVIQVILDQGIRSSWEAFVWCPCGHKDE